MLSSPKRIDASPDSTVLWRSGFGLDGEPIVLPPRSLVTSRGDRRSHWALVCESDGPINAQEPGPAFTKAEVRNLVSGKVPAELRRLMSAGDREGLSGLERLARG